MKYSVSYLDSRGSSRRVALWVVLATALLSALVLPSCGPNANALDNSLVTLVPDGSSPLPAGTEGKPYSTTISCLLDNLPASCTFSNSVGMLPNGLTLKNATDNSGNGIATISGTPTAPGTFNFDIVAIDTSAGKQNFAAYTLTINPIPGAPKITSANNTTFSVGTPGTFTIMATGSTPMAIGTSGPLPSGVGIHNNNDGTALLMGTPAAGTAGTYPFVIRATNNAGEDDQNFTLTVAASALTSVTVSPATTSVAVGNTVSFHAMANEQNGGSLDVTAQANWTSSNTSVAVVSNATGTQGQATGIAQNAQPVTITATFQGLSGTAQLTVTAPVLASVFVGPSTASVAVGSTVSFKATGTFSDQSNQDITASVNWTSSDANVATVGSANTGGTPGLATGVQVSAQPVTITATDPTTNVFGTAQLTVTGGSAGFVALVSENAAGTGGGNNHSQFPFEASMTGRYVAFVSHATDVVTSPAPLPAGAPVQIYLRDTCIGAPASPACTPSTQMVSVDNSTPPNASNQGSPSQTANISGDGSVTTFDSPSTNLISGAPVVSAYERQLCGVGIGGCPTSTILESLDNSGNTLTAASPVVSRDGRFIAFGANNPQSGFPDFPVLIRDTCLGGPSNCNPSTTLVSVDNSGNVSNGFGVAFAVSNGGRYVLFLDNGTNMPNGGSQIYVRDTCQKFGTGAGLPGCTPVTTTVSVGNAPPIPITDAGEFPSMSDDGRYVEFVTANSLVTNDKNSLPDVYIRDTCLQFGIGANFNPGAVANCAPTTTLVSVADSGNATANGAFSDSFALDATGRFVVFGASANDMVVTPPVPNGFLFGYARDTCLQYGTAPNINPGAVPGCTPRTVLVTIDSTGTPVQVAGTLNIDGDGHLVVFNFTPAGTNISQVGIGSTSF